MCIVPYKQINYVGNKVPLGIQTKSTDHPKTVVQQDDVTASIMYVTVMLLVLLSTVSI